jgi:hypothetical protein
MTYKGNVYSVGENVYLVEKSPRPLFSLPFEAFDYLFFRLPYKLGISKHY